MNVNIYLLSSTNTVKQLAPLLTDAIKDDKVLIICSDRTEMHKLDSALWTYSQLSFLPHATVDDPYPEQQPILLTTDYDNKNNSNIALFFQCQPDLEQLKDKIGPTRISVIFSIPDDFSLAVSSESAVTLSDLPTVIADQLAPLISSGYKIYIIGKNTNNQWNKYQLI